MATKPMGDEIDIWVKVNVKEETIKRLLTFRQRYLGRQRKDRAKVAPGVIEYQKGRNLEIVPPRVRIFLDYLCERGLVYKVRKDIYYLTKIGTKLIYEYRYHIGVDVDAIMNRDGDF